MELLKYYASLSNKQGFVNTLHALGYELCAEYLAEGVANEETLIACQRTQADLLNDEQDFYKVFFNPELRTDDEFTDLFSKDKAQFLSDFSLKPDENIQELIDDEGGIAGLENMLGNLTGQLDPEGKQECLIM